LDSWPYGSNINCAKYTVSVSTSVALINSG
jgi:hypothetical protein